MDVNVGARIRQFRMAEGISLRAMASQLQVSPATLSNIETGKTDVNTARLRRIAEVLDTTAEVLVGADRPVARAVGATVGAATVLHAGQDWRDYSDPGFDPVLAAALGEFMRAGYHGTAMREIATAAGMSVSGLYHYYASKQEMLHAIMRFAMTELLERADSAIDGVHDPVARFSRLIEHLALWHIHRNAIGFVSASEMRSLEPAHRREITAMRVAQQNMVNREVDAAVASGRFATPDPHEAARAVVTMCVAIPTWYQADGPLAPSEIARQYVDFALGVVKHGGSSVAPE